MAIRTERDSAATPGRIRALLRSEAGCAWALSLLFLGLAGIGVLHHEMWRDEWQAWWLFAKCPSLGVLFDRLRAESQLPLWPLCIFAVGRLIDHPLAMQGLHVLIATASVFLFARFAPFQRWLKIVFAFGYFPFFEYAIISRNYALGFCFALLFCVAFCQRRRLLAAFALLGLAASSHQGLLLVLPMQFLLVRDWVGRSTGRGGSKKVALVSLGVVALLAACLWALFPVQRVLGTHLHADIDCVRAVRTTATIWNAYVPLPPPATEQIWDTNLLDTYNVWENVSPHSGLTMADPLEKRELWAFLFSVALVVLGVRALSRARALAAAFLACVILQLLFSYAVYFGSLRHHGHLLLALVMCVWLSRGSVPRGGAGGFRNPSLGRFLPALLLIQMAAGITFYVLDLVRPFSPSAQVAQFTREIQWGVRPIIGSPDYLMSPVAAILWRSFRSLDTGERVTAIDWSAGRDLDPTTVARRIAGFVRRSMSRKLLLVTGYSVEALAPVQRPLLGPTGIQLTPIHAFGPGLVPDERYIVYFVQPRGDPVPKRMRSLAIGETFTF
ncbi:MAG: hypothetical protein V2A76_09370 [Planctomycetota bacterium]